MSTSSSSFMSFNLSPEFMWLDSDSYSYRNDIIMKRQLSQWVSKSHIPCISPNIIFIYVLFSHALFWAYVTPVTHIKSAWVGLDAMIFYCCLYYRWYLLLFKVSIICCKIKTEFSKVIILYGGHWECLFIFILKWNEINVNGFWTLYTCK